MNSVIPDPAMMCTPICVLIVEDVQFDAELIAAELSAANFFPTWTRVDTERDYLSALELSPPDIILADYTMPHFGAQPALTLLQEHGLSIPFVVVSGTIGEMVAVALIKQGADDYVHKSRLNQLAPVVRRALAGIGKIVFFNGNRYRVVDFPSEPKTRRIGKGYPSVGCRSSGTDCRHVLASPKMLLQAATRR